MRTVLVVVLVLVGVAEGQAQKEWEVIVPTEVPHTIVFGSGWDAGFLGVKYTHRFTARGPINLSAGMGLAGVTGNFVWSAFTYKAWMAYVSTGLTVAPWESPLADSGSGVMSVGIGGQHWPLQSWGLYLNVGIEPYALLWGHLKSNKRIGVVPRLQVGISF